MAKAWRLREDASQLDAMIRQPFTAGACEEIFENSFVGGRHTAGQAHRGEECAQVGEGWFCRGALRGRSPCTREGRRPDRTEEQ